MWRSILLFLLLPAGDALAYKPAPPKRHDVPSPDGAFVLDVDPQAKRFTVFAAGKRDQPLWSFQRHVGLGEHLLANDGKVVTILRWWFVTVDELDDGVCIEFWNQTGKFKQYSFADVCPHPRRYWMEPGPVGLFWRKWYDKAEGKGATPRVQTTDEFEYVFAMDDGRILETARIGLPWWSWWAFLIVAIGGGVFVLIRRWRVARRGKPSTPIHG